ncbi:LCP family protein [Acetobacterium sp.]|uniref:LCP family protein n=1 Tax=Acetobacterium sp. TaxID=1872094 RepID=UPI0035946AB4
MKKKKNAVISVGLILLIIGVFAYVFTSDNSNNRTESDNESNSSFNEEASLSIEDVLNKNNEDLLKFIDTRKTVVFAIYGIDDKTTEEGRSDIIMVIKYDPTVKKMVIVSIPRDLRVDVPGYGMTKINHAYAYEGEQLINQVVEELLGVKLDFSVKLNFDTFSSIIDDVGGVEINAKKQFLYDDNSLAIDQGSQTLNGKDALFYVRFRSDSDVDYGRIGRQQEVVISLMEDLKSISTKEKIKLVTTYYDQGIKTDANLNKIIDYIKMSKADNDIVYENYRLPTYSEVIDGLWYELYRQEDLDMIKNLFDKKEEMNLENWK